MPRPIKRLQETDGKIRSEGREKLSEIVGAKSDYETAVDNLIKTIHALIKFEVARVKDKTNES